MMDKQGRYGAPIERGRVLSVENGRATVAGFDRDGLVARELQIMAGQTVSTSDIVFFCAFSDGRGLVLAVMEGEK